MSLILATLAAYFAVRVIFFLALIGAGTYLVVVMVYLVWEVCKNGE